MSESIKIPELEDLDNEAARQRYLGVMDELDEGDRRLLTTHLVFVLLHVSVRVLAAHRRSRGLLTTVESGQCEFTVRSPGRAVCCSFELDQDGMDLEYQEDGDEPPFRKTWCAPDDEGPNLVNSSVDDLLADIELHLGRRRTKV